MRVGIRARRAKRQRGVSLVEFVAVAPVALFFVLAIIQFGFVFMAKLNLDHATFMAARYAATNGGLATGAVNGANAWANLIKGLIPFYQDSTDNNDFTRMAKGYGLAAADALLNLSVQRLNPPTAAFDDFGLTGTNGVRVIPNDNLETRAKTAGPKSKMSIQDANVLKIKATYGYQMKVPLVPMVMKAVMCGFGGGGPPVWQGSVLDPSVNAGLCARYFTFGRIPLVAYATVQMQSPVLEK